MRLTLLYLFTTSWSRATIRYYTLERVLLLYATLLYFTVCFSVLYFTQLYCMCVKCYDGTVGMDALLVV